jgi:WhiB family redox-sensing transcriptional regulator
MTTRAAAPYVPEIVNKPGPWTQDGHCVGSEDPDLWFRDDTHRERQSNSYSSDVNYAVQICQGCPVRLACLEYALDVPQASDWGVWGATTAAERRTLRRKQRRAA